MIDEKVELEGPSASEDALADKDLDLLEILFKEHPEDAGEFMRPLPVSGGYADDPRTVCSVQEGWVSEHSQSRLGFLNQFREFRGLPRIALCEHKGVVEEIGLIIDGKYRCCKILRMSTEVSE